MTLKEIKIGIVFGISKIQFEKLNNRKKLSESQWNPKGAPILCKIQS